MIDPLVDESSMTLEKLSELIYSVDTKQSEELRFLHRKLSESLSMATESGAGPGDAYEEAVEAARGACKAIESGQVDEVLKKVTRLIDMLSRLHHLTA